MKLIRLRPILLGLAAGLALSQAAGCASSPSHGTASASPSLSVKPAPSPSDEADRAAALDAYRKFWAEQVKAYAQGTSNGTDLEKYSTDKALGTVRIDLSQQAQAGITFTGSPQINPTVTSIDITSSPKVAELQDCLDVSGWKPIYQKTGAAVPVPSQTTRFVVTAKARTVGSDWKVIEMETNRSKPC